MDEDSQSLRTNAVSEFSYWMQYKCLALRVMSKKGHRSNIFVYHCVGSPLIPHAVLISRIPSGMTDEESDAFMEQRFRNAKDDMETYITSRPEELQVCTGINVQLKLTNSGGTLSKPTHRQSALGINSSMLLQGLSHADIHAAWMKNGPR